jgi:hypothetical protein
MPKKPKWNEVPCPQCKEPIAPSANRCPHCQTDFTPAQVEQRTKDHSNGIKFGCAAMLGIVLLLGWCTSPAPEQPAEITGSSITDTAPSPSREQLDAAAQKAESNWPRVALPAGAPAAPLTAFCLTEMCEAAKAQFGRNDWPKAWSGDYQGQRNAAFCRANGCDGAVQVNQVEACAWRTVIVETQPELTEDTDANNFKIDCGKLDPAGMATAARKAEDMLARLKGKNS